VSRSNAGARAARLRTAQQHRRPLTGGHRNRGPLIIGKVATAKLILLDPDLGVLAGCKLNRLDPEADLFALTDLIAAMPLEQNVLAAGPPDYQRITATIAHQVLFELLALVGLERWD
jgi:hypothetical protein